MAVVGRSGKCHISLPDDALMEARQLCITNTGSGFQVTNLSPKREMVSEGAVQVQSILPKGGKISCGRTKLLLVHPEAEFSIAESPLQKLASGLASLRSPLLMFTPVDAPEAMAILTANGRSVLPVFEGERQEELGDLAPVLAEVPAEAPIIVSLLRATWGRACSTWIADHAGVGHVRSIWRRLAIVHDGEQPIYFRFYDPRVLHGFLRGCNDGERATLFAGIGLLVLEGRQPHGVTAWRFGLDSAACEQHSLEERWQIDVVSDWAKFLAPLYVPKV